MDEKNEVKIDRVETEIETVERKMCSWNNNKKVEPKQSHWRIPKCIECKRSVERKIVSWNKNMNNAHKFTR